MTFLVITDNELYAEHLCAQIGSEFGRRFADQLEEEKIKPPSIRPILTRNNEFATLNVLHEVFNSAKFDSQTILLVDAELICNEQRSRQDLHGVEIAYLCKTALRIGFRGAIYVFGFRSRNVIAESERGAVVNESFGIHYLNLPLSKDGIGTILPADEEFLLEGEEESEIRHLEAIRAIGQTYLIGMIDDDARIRIPSLKLQLDKIWKPGPRLQDAIIIDFPFSPDQTFEANFDRLSFWIHYIEVFDLLLLDLRFKCAFGEREWGLEILRLLSRTGISVPIAMLSSTSDRDSIVKSTVDYKDIVRDYILADTTTGGHAGEIKNYDYVADKIWNGLKQEGAVRNRFGVLITHGTDTMAWTLSLLRYAVKGQTANIILTGSQISLQSEFSPSDAPANLISALYFLNQVVPPITGVVFDQGRKLYQSNLMKVRIWDMNAYEGQQIAAFNWEEMKSDHKLLRFDNTLDRLLVFTTGGTIAMEKTEEGMGKASQEPMTRFFGSNAGRYRNPRTKSRSFYYREPLFHGVCNIDSSEMCPPIYEDLLVALEEQNNSLRHKYGEGFADSIDKNFRWNVYPIFCSPFFTTEDYERFLQYSLPDKPVVFILLAFGAGNVSPNNDRGYSPIVFVKKAVKKDIVILSSQVSIETPDIDYDVANEFIEAGAIPSGNMSLSELFMKCAYLLGHYNNEGLDFLKSAILSGVQFRSEQSRNRYLLKLNDLRRKGKQCHVVPSVNYFINKSYEEAKKEVNALLR